MKAGPPGVCAKHATEITVDVLLYLYMQQHFQCTGSVVTVKTDMGFASVE